MNSKTRGAADPVKPRVLRRRSWPIATWSGIALIWAIYPFSVRSFLEHDNIQDIWIVMSVLWGVTALMRRIGSCRVLLFAEAVVVENPLKGYLIPYMAVRSVDVGTTGSISIETYCEKEILPLAFGGSLVDTYFNTSQKATSEIENMVLRRPRKKSSMNAATARSEFRRCWSADISVLLALVSASVGMLVA